MANKNFSDFSVDYLLNLLASGENADDLAKNFIDNLNAATKADKVRREKEETEKARKRSVEDMYNAFLKVMKETATQDEFYNIVIMLCYEFLNKYYKDFIDEFGLDVREVFSDILDFSSYVKNEKSRRPSSSNQKEEIKATETSKNKVAADSSKSNTASTSASTSTSAPQPSPSSTTMKEKKDITMGDGTVLIRMCDDKKKAAPSPSSGSGETATKKPTKTNDKEAPTGWTPFGYTTEEVGKAFERALRELRKYY